MERFIRLLVLVITMVLGIVPMAMAQVPFDFHAPYMADVTADGGGYGSFYGQGFHTGPSQYCIDFNVATGWNDYKYPVVAVAGGMVTAEGVESGVYVYYDYDVRIDHGNGYSSTYVHLVSNTVSLGERVNQGQVIGFTGNEGKSDGPHLHFCIFGSDGWTVKPSPMDGTEYEDSGDMSNDVTSENNTMFSDVEDSYSGFIGPATNAVHFYQSGVILPYAHDVTPSVSTQTTYQPDDVYIQNHDASGTSPGTSAIIYDAYGGARKAYLVRSGFWTFYDRCGGPNGDCSVVEDTGETCKGTANPNVHDCGSPINDEYEQEGGTEARQDFQSCYLYYDGDCVTTNTYPLVAPGWTDNGWNSTYSYAFAEVYQRNGKRTWMGEATTTVGDWSGELVQEFDGGYWGDLAVVHNPENNKAYLIRTGFWDKYQVLGPSAVGYACQDEVPTQSGAQQGFEKLTMYWNGSTVTTVAKSSEEYGCEREADDLSGSGGSYTPSEDDLLVYGSTIYWVHNGYTHGVVSAEMFEACGFSWEDPYPVTEEVFNSLPQGDTVHDPVSCGAVTDGTLVNQNGTVYEYWEADASWHGYPSELVFNACLNDWSSIQEMSSSVFATITIGSVVGSAFDCGVVEPGDLLHWNSLYYQITEDGLKQPFGSDLAYAACGHTSSEAEFLADEDWEILSSLADDTTLWTSVDCGVLAEGDLVHWNGTVYRITDTGLKRGFTSSEVFNACGYDWDLITYLSDAEYPVVTTLGDGSAISSTADCSNVQGDLVHWEWTGTVYYLTGTGYKRGVTSTQAMTSCGFDWSEVRYVTNANGAVVWTLGDAANITGNGDCP